MDVDGGSEKDACALAARLLPEDLADLTNEIGVPRRRQRRPARETNRTGTAEAGAAGTVGTVADLDGGHTQPLDAVVVPEVGPADDGDLLLQRHLFDNITHGPTVGVYGSSVPRRVTVVLVSPCGEVWGALPPFEVATPFWMQVGEVVSAVR